MRSTRVLFFKETRNKTKIIKPRNWSNKNTMKERIIIKTMIFQYERIKTMNYFQSSRAN